MLKLYEIWTKNRKKNWKKNLQEIILVRLVLAKKIIWDDFWLRTSYIGPYKMCQFLAYLSIFKKKVVKESKKI